MAFEVNHRTSDIGAWHKAVLWYEGRYIRHGIVLNRKRKCAVVLASRYCLHPSCHLFLHHKSHIRNRNPLFKQGHDYRSCYVVRKI